MSWPSNFARIFPINLVGNVSFPVQGFSEGLGTTKTRADFQKQLCTFSIKVLNLNPENSLLLSVNNEKIFLRKCLMIMAEYLTRMWKDILQVHFWGQLRWRAHPNGEEDGWELEGVEAGHAAEASIKRHHKSVSADAESASYAACGEHLQFRNTTFSLLLSDQHRRRRVGRRPSSIHPSCSEDLMIHTVITKDEQHPYLWPERVN